VLRSAPLNWAASFVTPRNIGCYFGSAAMEAAVETLWGRQKRSKTLTALMPDFFVNRNATVVDIGASWGLFTYHFSHRVGREGTVYSYEPHPANSVVLQKLASKRSNVHFRPFAISDAVGTAEMLVPRHHNRIVTAQSSLAHGFVDGASVCVERIQVPTVRLDDEIDTGRRIDFVKIDVEGYEIPVLRGAASILRKWMPPILIEIEQRHLDIPIKDVFRELQDMGYYLYYIDGSSLRPVDEFDVQRDQISKLPADQFQPFGMPKDYVSNFCAVATHDVYEKFLRSLI
jgi:FkbM family methyltransferase